MKKGFSVLLAGLVVFGFGMKESFASSTTYTVKSGDTLSHISQANNTSVANLMKWNDLKGDLIFPNDELVVSGGQATKAASSSKANGSTYTIQSGDTLYRIATNHNTSVSNLKAWNNLSSDLIFPNQKLSVNGKNTVAAPKQVNTSAPKQAKVAQKAAPAKAKQEVKKSTPASQTKPKTEKNVITMEATAYTAFCNGCSGVTSTGIDLRSNPNQKVIAVDPSVIPLGSKVYVEGYGTAIAGDTGGAIKGNRIDVFYPNQNQALNWGRKQVKVQVLN